MKIIIMTFTVIILSCLFGSCKYISEKVEKNLIILAYVDGYN